MYEGEWKNDKANGRGIYMLLACSQLSLSHMKSRNTTLGCEARISCRLSHHETLSSQVQVSVQARLPGKGIFLMSSFET